MSVVLTGDVHHAIGAADQSFSDRSEAALAVEYAEIAARQGLKVTLFFTGKAVLANGDEARPLLGMEHVEIGGHGWDAFKPRLWHGAMNRLLGSPHGPPWLQRRMIRRTCETVTRWSEQPVTSWRNHAYRHDSHTARLLHEAGIRAWSDEVDPERVAPYRHTSGVAVVPINTVPDHEYLRHGGWPKESATLQWGGPAYVADEWYQRVCTAVETIAQRGGVATILAHPICMKVLDDWATFERLCAFLARYPSVRVREAAELACTY